MSNQFDEAQVLRHSWQNHHRLGSTGLWGQMFRSFARGNPKATKASPDEMVAYINALIRQQTEYGLKMWPVRTMKSTILVWSNAWARWDAVPLSRWVLGRPSEVKLDANCILVPFPKKSVEPLLSKLEDLPLYKFSCEGRMRSISNP